MFIALVVLAIVGIVVGTQWLKKCKPCDDDSLAIMFIVIGTIVFGLCVVATLIDVEQHADNLGTLRAQKAVIAVQETYVASLKASLREIVSEKPGSGPSVVLNADSPIRSLVESLSVAEKTLSEARVAEAQAKVNIAQRKAGMMWFIVWIYGEV